MNPVIPSRNPTDDGSLAGLLKIVLEKSLRSTDVQLPCEIVSYNRVTNRAIVRPLINLVATSGAKVSRAQIASVPVLALGGGGFCITFPLVAGNKGWIEASDRDISLFLQAMAQTAPNTQRMHSFEDGRFIPDIFGAYTHNATDDGAMVIQSTDGTVRISLATGVVNITAPQINVNGPTQFNSPVTMPAGATISGISFATHHHAGVTIGTGNTGGPV